VRCKECGEECSVVRVDFGIGAYEYWGATGTDINPQDVSNCCEADVLFPIENYDYTTEIPINNQEGNNHA
jgi:hypothetical protein